MSKLFEITAGDAPEKKERRKARPKIIKAVEFKPQQTFMVIPIGEPWIKENEIQLVTRVLALRFMKSEWYTVYKISSHYKGNHLLFWDWMISVAQWEICFGAAKIWKSILYYINEIENEKQRNSRAIKTKTKAPGKAQATNKKAQPNKKRN